MGNKCNLGSGNDYRHGWVNVDINPKYKPDIVHDLDIYPYPFAKNQFNFILSSGLIEHIERIEEHIKELKRISEMGCTLVIHVPYFLSYFSECELPKHKFSLNCVEVFKIFEKYGWKLTSKKLNISNNPCLSWLNPLINLIPNFWERFPLIIPEGIDWEFILVSKPLSDLCGSVGK